MKSRAIIVGFILLSCTSLVGAAPKLDGAYKLVSIKAPNGTQTADQVKGMMVVHGNNMAFIRVGANRQTWDQQEAADERNKKIIAAFQGMAATCGSFEIQGDTIVLTQYAQASPSSVGTSSKWQFKLEGDRLTIKPDGNATVEFIFERLPDKK